MNLAVPFFFIIALGFYFVLIRLDSVIDNSVIVHREFS